MWTWWTWRPLLSDTRNWKISEGLTSEAMNAIINDSYMKKLVTVRKKKGLSQRALAKVSGVGHITIARLEVGQFDPRLSTLRALAKALKVKVADLID